MAAVSVRRGERLRREGIQGLVWFLTAVLVVVPLLPLVYASVLIFTISLFMRDGRTAPWRSRCTASAGRSSLLRLTCQSGPP
jgi:hypothetical protein